VKVSVVICTHDRVELLQRTLDSLNRAERPSACELEIRVVANACTDNTHAWLDGYQSDCAERGWLPLHWEIEPEPGKSRALNRILPKLTSRITAFVDDDHRVDPGYLVGVCRAARDYPEADFFCGRILPDWEGTEPAWVHDRGRYRIYPLPVPTVDLGPEPIEVNANIAVPGGGNLVIRTDLYRRVGPFAVDLGPVGHNLGGGEDSDWVLRALALGAKLRYVPYVVQHHYVDPERLRLSYLLRKAYERSASTVRVREAAEANGRLPPYMLRKAGGYVLYSLLAWRPRARRFYLVRLAAALGEIKGFLTHKPGSRA